MDVLIDAVLIQESAGYDTQIHETKSLVQMKGVDIGSHHRIELQYAITVCLRLCQAIPHQQFSDMFSSALPVHGITGVGDMSHSADIVGMQNI